MSLALTLNIKEFGYFGSRTAKVLDGVFTNLSN